MAQVTVFTSLVLTPPGLGVASSLKSQESLDSLRA